MLLNLSLGTERYPVNIENLAREYATQFGHDDPITNIVSDDLPGFEGALYGLDSGNRREWTIIYNSAIEVAGRTRFTLAHELGHYILHRTTRATFECSQDDMLRWESDEKRIESEADIFASYLLMPIDDFRERIGHDVVDLDVIDDCAKRYGVSLTAAVLKWLEFTSQRAVLVVSTDGYILWARSSQPALKSGVYFKTRGRVVPVPEGSLAIRADVSEPERQGIEVSARTWFNKEPEDMALREMKIVSDRYDRTLSLLILPDAEPIWSSEAHQSDIGLDEHIRSGHFSKK